MFSIPSIDNLSRAELTAHIKSWLQQDTSISIDISALDQAFNFALPRTIFLKSLPTGSNVLDVGAGDGSLVNFKQWPYFLRDDLRMHALSLDKGQHFDRYDSYEIKNFETDPEMFGDMAFDAIVCCHFLEHMSDPMKSIEFFCKRLRKNGRIYIEWPHPCTKSFPQSSEVSLDSARIMTLNFFDDDTHIDAWQGSHILNLLETAGFAVEAGGRVHMPWLGEQLKNHAIALRDDVRMTIGSWSAFGWAQYVIATKL